MKEEELKILREKLEKMKEDSIFLSNVCLSYRHDFGLLPPEVQCTLMNMCRRWIMAISNNLDLKK